MNDSLIKEMRKGQSALQCINGKLGCKLECTEKTYSALCKAASARHFFVYGRGMLEKMRIKSLNTNNQEREGLCVPYIHSVVQKSETTLKIWEFLQI